MANKRPCNVGGQLRPGDIVRVVGGTLEFVERSVNYHDDTRTVWYVFNDGDVTVAIPAGKLAQHFGGPNGGRK